MNRLISKTANAATWVLAAMPMIALAGAVHAQEIRVRVGDLSQPTAAAAFDQRIDAAATAICQSYYRPIDGLSRMSACKAAVRQEAMDKLASARHVRLSQGAVVSPAT